MSFFDNCNPYNIIKNCCSSLFFRRGTKATPAARTVSEIPHHPQPLMPRLILPPRQLAEEQCNETIWVLPETEKSIEDNFIKTCLDEFNHYVDGDIIKGSFRFEHLSKPGQSFSGTYYQAFNNVGTHFISLNLRNKSTGFNDHGWKFHIDLDNSIENLCKAWDCVVPILFHYGINLFKMLAPGTSASIIQGRSMTLYVQRETLTLKQWECLLNEINLALISNNIRPGERSLACRELIPNNLYFSYRNDNNGYGGYCSVYGVMELSPQRRYNPGNYFDPFGSMALNEIQTLTFKP